MQDNSSQLGSVPGNTSGIPEKKKSNKSILFLLWLFTALLFTGLGAGGYYFLTKDKEDTAEEKTCSYNETTYKDGETFEADDGCNECLCYDGEVVCTKLYCDDGDTVNGDTGTYEGWETYTFNCSEDFNFCLDFTSFSFKYPKDWSVDDDITKDTMLITVDSNTGYGLKLSYGSLGSSDCIYSDNQETKEGSLSWYEHDTFEELSNNAHTYRISPFEGEIFAVCEKYEDMAYSNLTTFGWIDYSFPIDGGDETYIEILDNILLSLEEL